MDERDCSCAFMITRMIRNLDKRGLVGMANVADYRPEANESTLHYASKHDEKVLCLDTWGLDILIFVAVACWLRLRSSHWSWYHPTSAIHNNVGRLD